MQAPLVKDIAKAKAEETLRAHGDQIPVDPRRIAAELGIVVRDVLLEEGTSGLILKRRDEDPLIMVHSPHSELRKRFTIAHEIGHFIERTDVQQQPDEDFGFVEARGRKSDVHEYFANEYAGNLLMPEEQLRQAHAEDSSAIALAGRFGVSVDAMKTRLLKLGLLA